MICNEREGVLVRLLIMVVDNTVGTTARAQKCIEKERNAFLELKKFIISEIAEEEDRDYVFNTWTNDTKSDCCQWEGVECSLTSGQVTKIAFGECGVYVVYGSLLNLSLLHPFEEVRILDLTGFGFSGFFDHVEGYHSLKRLRNLETLNLTNNNFDNRIFPFLHAATSLTTLSLKENFMGGSFPAKELKDLRNLEILDLRQNNFIGSISLHDLYPFRNLELLDLSYNKFNGSIPQDLSALRKLKALGLSYILFNDSMIFQGICKLKHLQELDISHNSLVGQFPLCLTSLTSLRVLDLSRNQMNGKLPSTLGSLESLEYISLYGNDFEGSFSLGSLTNLSELKVFRLDSKSNSLQVESEDFWKPKFQLNAISLGNCKLKTVPHFLLYQKDLHHVDLSGNNISGNFPTWLLENNTKLEVLILHNNSFTNFQLPESQRTLLYLDVSVNKFDHLFPENIGWILTHLQHMNISYSGFRGTLPSSLGNIKVIKLLDISHNRFHGELPRSFLKGCHSLKYLKLSHNKLSGEIIPESANLTRMEVLYMDNSQFTGKIGQGLGISRNLAMLDFSNNNFSGVIPNLICEFIFLEVLRLSNNSLEGEIPSCLFNKSRLRLLDLSANTLFGNIPPYFGFSWLEVILLQDNNLSGKIQDTWPAFVQILDLRNNRFFGHIPEFINPNGIKILLLSGNHLTGHIPRHLCALKYIRLLDLSNNKLSGSIPSCLSNTPFYRDDETYSIYSDFGFSFNYITYFESLLMLDKFIMEYQVAIQTEIEFATKHRYDAYMGKNLGFLRGMDLSRNEMSGEIPEELDGLMKLNTLNLSRNKLSGMIPKSLSGMKDLESLDLSFNRLQSHIPPELTDLNSLAVFNVSYNNLSGVIPQGKQFNTFDTPSYLGNPLLCGKPTDTGCARKNTLQEPINEVSDDESIIDMVSFYWSCGAAYVVLLLGTLVLLSFDSPVSRAWFYFVDVSVHKVRRKFF